MMKLVTYFPLFGGPNRAKQCLAQRKIVSKYTQARDRKVIAEFEETESETNLDELQKAMAVASDQGAVLVFTRLGYLSRNLKFLRALAEGGPDLQFRALDDKHFNPGNFQLYLAQAKDVWHERRNRIKDEMSKRKKQGVKFGSRRPGAQSKNWRAAEPWNAAAEASGILRMERTAAAYAQIVPQMQKMRAKGMSFAEIAKALNEGGHVTTTNIPFSAPTVFKILKRFTRHGGQNGSKGGNGLGRQAHARNAR